MEFTAGEIALLKEVSFELNEKGEVEERQRFTKFIGNFKFACISFARANRSTFRLSYDNDGFECFRSTFRIRDRLMHPKSKKDLNISDGEEQAGRKAWAWYQANFAALFKDCIETSTAYTKTVVERART